MIGNKALPFSVKEVGKIDKLCDSAVVLFSACLFSLLILLSVIPNLASMLLLRSLSSSLALFLSLCDYLGDLSRDVTSLSSVDILLIFSGEVGRLGNLIYDFDRRFSICGLGDCRTGRKLGGSFL